MRKTLKRTGLAVAAIALAAIAGNAAAKPADTAPKPPSQHAVADGVRNIEWP